MEFERDRNRERKEKDKERLSQRDRMTQKGRKRPVANLCNREKEREVR